MVQAAPLARKDDMRNRLLATAVMVALIVLLYGCACATPSTDAVVETTYEPNMNYMALMIEAAINGDQAEVWALNDARNAKIKDAGLPDSQITTEAFLSNFKQYAGFSLDVDYDQELVACCVSGDMTRGAELAGEYAKKQLALGLSYEPFEFYDLFLVSKIIYNEAGSNWLSQDWKMKVGEVLLNRVDSPEFPNTVEDCVYQKGQYSGSGSTRFKKMLPNEGSAQAALRLMKGERVINDPAVVFQSNFRGASRLYEKMHDSVLGNTYLCYSYHMELYEGR